MRDQTLFFWGMVVTIFIMIAAILTARELFEMYLDERARNRARKSKHADTSHLSG